MQSRETKEEKEGRKKGSGGGGGGSGFLGRVNWQPKLLPAPLPREADDFFGEAKPKPIKTGELSNRRNTPDQIGGGRRQ